MIDRLVRALGLRLWQLGMGGTLLFLARRLFGRRLGLGRLPSLKRDVRETFGMTTSAEIRVVGGEEPRAWLNWIVPPFSIGSGGHTTIFRMIAMLEARGFRNRLYFVGETLESDPAAVKTLICEHFARLEAEVYLGVEPMRPAEFVVATSWNTAYWAAACCDISHRLYFVQDFEPYFYPCGSEYAFAEQTYRLGLTAITAGDWLAAILSRDYGMRTYPFRFSYDKVLYRPAPRAPGPRRVFFYARHVTPRRGFELGMLALIELHRRLPDIEVILAGWDAREWSIPFPHLDAGTITAAELARCYADSDAALVLSFTNLSLVPLEVMACGCPLVSNRGANVEWILRDGENALLCDAIPQALSDGLYRVLTDDALRQRLINGGLASARATDWDAEGDRLAEILEGIRERP